MKLITLTNIRYDKDGNLEAYKIEKEAKDMIDESEEKAKERDSEIVTL